MRQATVITGLIRNPTFAQDLEPRKYVNNPVDQDFFRTATGYSTGEVDISPGIPIKDADLDMVGGSFAWLRTMDIGGRSSSLDAYLAYICADGSAAIDGTPRNRNRGLAAPEIGALVPLHHPAADSDKTVIRR